MRWRPTSLRLRLSLGTASLAALVVACALLVAFGLRSAQRHSEDAAAAQRHLDALAALSARISDYALAPPELRAAAEADVRRSFEILHGLAAGEAARAPSPQARERHAVRTHALARMQGAVELLQGELPAADSPAARQALLNGFAALFAPLYAREIEVQRQRRDAALADLRALHRTLGRFAAGLAVAAPLIVVLLHLVLTRPLILRLREATALTRALGRPGRVRPLPVGARDEVGHLFARLNLTTARLERARRTVEADRAGLERTVAARTAELQAANARLARIDEDRRRFFADVGHELRTPLTVILAEAELGRSEAPFSEAEAREAFAIIAARARRLARRVDDLLRIARSESGVIELQTRPFDPAEAARAAVDDLAQIARRAGVGITPRLTPGLRVLGDADWTRQVVAGLIDNAVRHAPPASSVEVRLAREAGRVCLSVTDAGGGVPPAEQEQVFVRHFRGRDRGRRAPGFGVGLALARWVVEDQGGEIVLESPVADARRLGADGDTCGPGTRVTIRLPEAVPA